MALEWLIDMLKEWVQAYHQGMIVIWSGTLDNIPDGWALCDGSNGTPDLRTRFIIGAHAGFPVGSHAEVSSHIHALSGHTHDFTGDGHQHKIDPGIRLAVGAFQSIDTSTDPAVGTTDSDRSIITAALHLPPYYALAFIMKL